MTRDWIEEITTRLPAEPQSDNSEDMKQLNNNQSDPPIPDSANSLISPKKKARKTQQKTTAKHRKSQNLIARKDDSKGTSMQAD